MCSTAVALWRVVVASHCSHCSPTTRNAVVSRTRRLAVASRATRPGSASSAPPRPQSLLCPRAGRGVCAHGALVQFTCLSLQYSPPPPPGCPDGPSPAEPSRAQAAAIDRRARRKIVNPVTRKGSTRHLFPGTNKAGALACTGIFAAAVTRTARTAREEDLPADTGMNLCRALILRSFIAVFIAPAWPGLALARVASRIEHT